MTAEPNKPIVLREVCGQCGKPKFPTRPGGPPMKRDRPGFCLCGDTAQSALAIGPDQGVKIKLPPQFGNPNNAGENSSENSSKTREAKAGPTKTKFDPNEQLPDLIACDYVFYDRVGKGTMGYVYQAKKKDIEALLAIKIFHRAPFENKRTLKRLEQEASVAIGVSHPHLASVYNFGVSQRGFPYIVMDFMAGPSLAELLSHEGYLDVPRAIDIFIQTAEGLEYAHGEKLLHRGLKPSNIYMLVSTGGRDFVKVADFGIAKVLPNPGRETKYMTPQGEEFGNPSYMSPEQCLGQRLDARSDIYSFGCVMYECLTGKLPHGSSNMVRIAFKQVSEPARSMVERFVDLDIPRELDDVVLACLQKNPQDRFATVKQLRLALEAVRDGKRAKMPGPAGGGTGSQAILQNLKEGLRTTLKNIISLDKSDKDK